MLKCVKPEEYVLKSNPQSLQFYTSFLPLLMICISSVQRVNSCKLFKTEILSTNRENVLNDASAFTEDL